MKKNIAKIAVLLLFLTLLLGAAYWMHLTFVKDKPVITIQEQKTSFDRIKADSMIKNQQGYKK
jgi:hypothetical protein